MHYKQQNHFTTFSVIARERDISNQYSYIHISGLMIIPHFTRLNGIFWMKRFIKHPRVNGRGEKERGTSERRSLERAFLNDTWLGSVVNLFFRSLWRFNYTEDNACLSVRVFPGSGNTSVCVEPSTPPSASSVQTPDRAPSRMAVGMSVPCERSKSSVALCSNHRGIYCPHDEWGKRIKRTG